MQDDAIVVDTIYKKYGNFTAVDGISFNVKCSEIFAFLGPNGAGKTTTAEILECLRSPTAGSVRLLGLDVRKDEACIKEKIGVLPQSFSAYDWLTVRENIDYFAHMYPKHVEVDGLIKLFGLEEKRNTLFKHLSGGQKQRVGIAIALVNDPEIVFLDEPTTGLDPKARRDVWEAVKALKSHHKTVFLTTHYMDEAYYLADRIDIIDHGKIIAEGSPEDLINSYGGGNTLVVRGCDSAVREALAGKLTDCRVNEDEVLATLPYGDGLASLSKAIDVISASGKSCKEVFVRKATLEDVFLNLTGKKFVEEAH